MTTNSALQVSVSLTYGRECLCLRWVIEMVTKREDICKDEQGQTPAMPEEKQEHKEGNDKRTFTSTLVTRVCVHRYCYS